MKQVLAVFISFAILLNLIQPEWKEVFFGLLPSAVSLPILTSDLTANGQFGMTMKSSLHDQTLVAPGATYTAIGIIGATVMPHALFLGSHLASIDRLDMVPRPPQDPATQSKKRRALLNFRKGKGRATEAQTEEYELEVRPTTHTLTGLNEDGVRPPVQHPTAGSRTEIEDERDAKNLSGPLDDGRAEEEDGSREEFSKAMKAYEVALSRFNRIRWVDLHLKHASVSLSLSPFVSLFPMQYS